MDAYTIQKLLAFGFAEQAGEYTYICGIADGQMTVAVTVTPDGAVASAITDNASGEEYVLHRVPSAEGAFVGRVRTEHDALLAEIALQCFGTAAFKNMQTQAVLAYVRDTYGDEPEFLWQSTPHNAIVRRKDNKKWYLAILTLSRQKLGIDSDEITEILDLRIDPERLPATVDHKRYFPGYHMNKKHWITVLPDGSVPLGEIRDKIDESYRLAKKSKSL